MQKLFYACNKMKLDPELRHVFFVSERSKQAREFQLYKTSWYQIKFMIFVLMNVVGLSHYNIMGILGYRTFLFEEKIIKEHILKRKKQKTLLDIGAGNWCITDMFQKNIPNITCIEPSASFQKILTKKGYTVLSENDNKKYDIVTIFNVLDICAHPEEIVKKALKNLTKDGTLVISLPFPICTQSWDISNIKKTNTLGQPKNKSFEMGVSEFYDTFLRKYGLIVTWFTRLPYLVSKPDSRNVTVYDNGVFICRLGD